MNDMKKIFKAMAVLSALMMTSSVFAENVFLENDGIELKGKINGVGENEKVTIVLIKDNEDFDWQNEKDWKGRNGQEIVYCQETKTDEDGEYSFKFALPENGKYKAYIGADYLVGFEEKSFTFIDKEENEKAILEVLSAENATELANVLKTKSKELGLIDEIYKDADFEDSAKILFSSTDKMNEAEFEEILTLSQKALVISMINSEEIISLEGVIDFICNDDLKKYYNENIDKAVLKALIKKDLQTIDDFDESFKNELIVCVIKNNDGTGDVKNILTENADFLGVSKNKITTSMCEDLIEKGSISDISDVIEFIEDYKVSTNTSNGGGGGGGGNRGNGNNLSSISGSNSLSGVNWQSTGESQIVTTEDVFSDIETVPWAKEAITELYNKGIINGTGEKNFSPLAKVKREEFAKMLSLSFQINLVCDSLPFKDVEKDSWCYDYVASMYEAKIVNGIGGEMFGKGIDITRESLCVMIYRALDVSDEKLNKTSEKTEFLDDAEISEYAREAVYALKEAGVVSGDENGRFNPKNGATRAEAAKIVYYTMNNKIDK